MCKLTIIFPNCFVLKNIKINHNVCINSNTFPPTFELPQLSLGQNSTSAFILELCLQLLYFHEEADGVCSDAWACNIFFLKFNVFMLPNEKEKKNT